MKTTRTNQKAFTIIELLTVMSIIVILIGLLVPALNSVRRYATGVKQHAQFNAIAAGLEMFRSDFDEYPDSAGLDPDDAAYCGAMKLAEAMVGQDLLGFHPDSTFRVNSILPNGLANGQYYRLTNPQDYTDSLNERKEPYLPVDKVPAFRLSSIYANADTIFPDAFEMFVLSDVFKQTQNLGQSGPSKVGMPVLYYKASESGQYHDPNAVTIGSYAAPGNIYNYCDNQDIIELQLPWDTATTHVFGSDAAGIDAFYEATEDVRIREATTSGSGVGSASFSRPYRPESYILISAGFDGRYGTSDDITNFEQ